MNMSDKFGAWLEKKFGITSEHKRRTKVFEFQIKLKENKDDLVFRISSYSLFQQISVFLLSVVNIGVFINFINNEDTFLQGIALFALLLALLFLSTFIRIQLNKTKTIVFSKKTNTFNLIDPRFSKKYNQLDLIKEVYIVKINDYPGRIFKDPIRYEVNIEYGDKELFYNVCTEKTYRDAKKIGTLIANYLNLKLNYYT